MLGDVVLLPTGEEVSNIYDAKRVKALASSLADPMEQASLVDLGRVFISNSTIVRVGSVLKAYNDWLPPAPDKTLHATWSVDGVNVRFLRFTAPDRLETVAGYSHLGFLRVSFQLRPGCFIEFGQQRPEKIDDYVLSTGLLVSATPHWKTNNFRLICEGDFDYPIIGLCPVSGVVLSAEDDMDEMESYMKCHISYLD